MTYLEQAAAVKLTGAKLMRAHDLMRARRERELAAGKTFDFMSAMTALLQAVPADFARDEIPAIALRLQALNALLDKEDLAGWALKDRDHAGLWRVNEALLEAAATATLDLAGDEPAFDLEAFKRIVLELADTDGRA